MEALHGMILTIEETCVTTAEAARILQMSKRGVSQAIERGTITSFTLKGYQLIPLSEVERYKAEVRRGSK